MQLKEGRYYLPSGTDPLDLIKDFGGPLYVYDTQVIKSQYNRLLDAFSEVEDVKISYACKALTNISILRYFKALGAGIDCVSIQEVLLGLKAGFEPRNIIFTPSGVSKSELTQVVQLGVRINIDSLEALTFLGKMFPGYPINLRIKPNILAGGNHKISVGHSGSKFGIPLSLMPEVLKIVENDKIKIEGIHIHTGSDIYDLEVFKAGAMVVFDVARHFKDLEFIDFGGGFKVPYKEGDPAVDIEVLGPQIAELFNSFCEEYGKQLTLVFEPGKFLVSACGYLLAPVNVVKDGGEKTFVHIDSGLNHLIRPMMYDAYHHIVNLSNPLGEEKRYDVVGYICEADTFADNRSLQEVQEGDILSIFNAGAYCFTMSSNYNARLRPAEVMILNGQAHLIRTKETMADILRNQIDIEALEPIKD